MTCTHISTKKVNFPFEFLKNKNIPEILGKLPFGTVQTELQISYRKCVIFTCKHESIDNFWKKSGIFGALQRRNLVKTKTKTIIAFAVSAFIYIWSLKMIEAQLVEIFNKTSRKSVISTWKIVCVPDVLYARPHFRLIFFLIFFLRDTPKIPTKVTVLLVFRFLASF